ncbi:GNAT family protein [Streptomyces gobitricini]|uniref:GNAT family protein n=1 Tax=Streptomyces gobitricini TaxID=68211 RepID=A0ABP5YE28_9ACTN
MTAEDLRIRPADPTDAPALAEALARNRDHLRPWEPRRPETYFTADAQAARLSAAGSRSWALAGTEGILGLATLSGIAHGPFRSAHLGYWVDARYTGRGLATRLVEHVCRAARDELRLHRIEAGTVLANGASQRVLLKSGFQWFGTAPRYLHIDGAWRDHHLFQRILHDDPPPLG